MIVQRLTQEDWLPYAKSAHQIVFGETPVGVDKFDFALVAEIDGVPQVYTTLREYDTETVYMRHGGAFPSAKDSIKAYRGYELFINRLKEMGYKRITTLVSNQNIVMLKFAMKQGLRIIGCRYIGGEIFLEHMIEF